MRTTLALVSVSFSLLARPSAEACGVPDPTVFQLSNHGSEGKWFAISSEAAPAGIQLRPLAPMTYDYSRFANAPDAAPQTLTLLGEDGAKVVTTTRHRVYLDSSWVSHNRGAHVALQLAGSRGNFSIAIAGRHPTATFVSPTDHRYNDSKALAWIRAHGIDAAPGSATVSQLPGSELEVITVEDKLHHMITAVRSKDRLVAQLDGWALGSITEYGERWIVTSNYDGTTRVGWLY